MNAWVMRCVSVDFLTGLALPNCGAMGEWYTLKLSGTQRVCLSNIVNVLGGDANDTNWSWATTWDIRNKNLGNVWVGLTNPSEKLTVQDSFMVNWWGGGSTPEMIYCHKTDTWVNKSSYIEDDCAVCPSGYAYDTVNNNCKKTCPGKCIGSNFPNANLCAGDDSWLVNDVNKTLVSSCTTTKKCEFTCSGTGYIYSGSSNSCVCDNANNYFLVGGKCVKCEAWTYNETTQSCREIPTCADPTNQVVVRSWSLNKNICVDLGDCYVDYIPNYSGAEGLFVLPKNQYPRYFIGANMHYEHDYSVDRQTEYRPLLVNKVWTYTSDRNALNNNTRNCLYTCKPGYVRDTDYNKCTPAYCSHYLPNGAFPAAYVKDDWYIQRAYASARTGMYAIRNLINADKVSYRFTFLDATGYSDFLSKANSQVWCRYWCENPFIYSGQKVCPIDWATAGQLADAINKPPKPSCGREPYFTSPRGELYRNPTWTWIVPFTYTDLTTFNNIKTSSWAGCRFTCKNGGILKPGSNDFCLPKCNSNEKVYSSRCFSCNEKWVATWMYNSTSNTYSILDDNGNNQFCKYSCYYNTGNPFDPNNEIYYNNSYQEIYNWACKKCLPEEMVETKYGTDTHGNYTNCINKCKEGETYRNNACLLLWRSEQQCPTNFIKLNDGTCGNCVDPTKIIDPATGACN